MTVHGGMMGEEACEVTDLSEDICGIVERAHSLITDGSQKVELSGFYLHVF